MPGIFIGGFTCRSFTIKEYIATGKTAMGAFFRQKFRGVMSGE